LVYLLAIAQSFLFTKRPEGLRPSHSIKSVVFLLDLLDGVCGKRYIKSASIEHVVVHCLIITSPLRLTEVRICKYYFSTSRPHYSYCSSLRDLLLLGLGD